MSRSKFFARSHGLSKEPVYLSQERKKLRIAIPMTGITVLHIADVVLEYCIMPYGVPDVVMTDKDKQFISKFLAAL